jgi:glycogen phosphorylase
MDARFKPLELDHRPMDVDAFKRSFLEWLIYSIGKDVKAASKGDWFRAVVHGVRDRIVDRWMDTTRAYYQQDVKRIYYLSLEFLIGRLLRDSLYNLNIVDICRQALEEVGVDLNEVLEFEPDAALGNGGLGRLAACFLDSMATLGLPGYGYGIRYDFGMFEQRFEDGRQIEVPESWLDFGNPWEFQRPEVMYPVHFYGRVEQYRDSFGHVRYRWVESSTVLAMAYDTPVVGYGGQTINTLRLWSARAMQNFDLHDFNRGNFMGAVQQKVLSENLTRVLYPHDETEAGKELRLKQEYFFTSASLQDILRRYAQHHRNFDALPEKIALQLNDTHPAIGVAELMRLLIDLYQLDWEKAWALTSACINYTNHTLMPEALEAWPVRMLERLLPRHMQIIYEINARFLTRVRAKYKSDDATISRLSLIDENGDRRVRMGHLAFVGSHRVNGVSALHTNLMKETVFADLHRVMPEKILNKTNGVTPRRWLAQANPGLASLLTESLGGSSWITDLDQLEALKPMAKDASFLTKFADAKRQNKERLANFIVQRTGIAIDPAAMFDIHVKRIHEYKRQLLNLLHTVALYNAIRDNPGASWTPTVKIFGGKAAAAYHMAKLIIKLGNDIASVINQDPAVRGLLKVVFLPNYNVTAAELLMPAADLSEQISTAGLEASGTGNMKFALNGALTIGTLDGANIEIKDAVGLENIFIFGKTASEANQLRLAGKHNPYRDIENTPTLKRALDMISKGVFSTGEPGRFQGILEALTSWGDKFLVTADFAEYCQAQLRAATLYREEPKIWQEKAVINTASVGFFSSDRTIREYAQEIWQVKPLNPQKVIANPAA